MEQSSIIAIVSGLSVIVSNIAINKAGLKSLKESLSEFKVEIKGEIKTEKNHAMQLADQRIGEIEKDVNEIFPRLRNAESKSDKNCIVVTQLQKDCLRKHKEAI